MNFSHRGSLDIRRVTRTCPHPAASPGWKDRPTRLFFRCFLAVCDTSLAPGWGWRGRSIPWDMSTLLCWWPLALHQPHLEPWGFSRAKPKGGSRWTEVFCWFMSPRWLGPGSGMLGASLFFGDELDFWVCPDPCQVLSPALPFPRPRVLFNHAKRNFKKLELSAASDRCVHLLWPCQPQVNEGIAN